MSNCALKRVKFTSAAWKKLKKDFDKVGKQTGKIDKRYSYCYDMI